MSDSALPYIQPWRQGGFAGAGVLGARIQNIKKP